MNLTSTVPIAMLVIVALSACAQMPAGNSTSHSLGVASAHDMPAAPTGERMAMMQYSELAARIDTEVGGILANCKLEPKADAMLHLLIADLGDGTRTMTGQNPKQRLALGLEQVAQTLDQYGSHFEHPGFKPIGIVH